MPAFEETVGSTSEVLNELVKRLNEYGRRISGLEQVVERIESRIGNVEQVAITQLNNLEIDLEKISQSIDGLAERLTKIENEILRLNKDLGKAALKSDLKKVETFIDVVNPVTSKFVTREEVERLLAEKTKKRA